MELTWEIVKFEAIEEIEEGMKEEFEVWLKVKKLKILKYHKT